MANEILASLDDINTHLPEDKAIMQEPDDDLLQISIGRVVKGYLSGTFTPVTLSSWNSPANTPGEIREIAGRLIAAAWYAKLYSEDTTDLNDYAQTLYNRAMSMLADIRMGVIQLIDLPPGTEVTAQGELTSEDFWPNDSTTPGPLFTMSKEFA